MTKEEERLFYEMNKGKLSTNEKGYIPKRKIVKISINKNKKKGN